MDQHTAPTASRVSVTDPFGIARDPALAHASVALDPAAVEYAFAHARHQLEELSETRIEEIRVVRHKPGRRCVIEYDLVDADGSPRGTVIGKIRRNRSGRTAFELARAFGESGFDPAAVDGISVPEAVAYVKKLGMWLQRKVPGFESTAMLETPAGTEIAVNIAEAAYKIHRAGVPAERVHGIDDELEILCRCLGSVSKAQPAWKFRLERLMQCARRIGETLHGRPHCGVHRDFYSDQVIVDRNRLWLLDFDLYCQGDPALDIGNFIGHVTEQSVRTRGYPLALSEVELAMERRYTALAGAAEIGAIHAYSLLTLMRHIYISMLHAERRHTTDQLLSICEVRAVNLLCGQGYRS
jgi:hypothetical protein